MLNIDLKKEFWDQKILRWEKEKYLDKSLLLDVNSSVKFRMVLTKKILSKISKNKTLLEIGCGSALLLNNLKKMGVKKYIGIDISSEAIKKAEIKAKKINGIEFQFINADVSKIKSINVDIFFSIGFLDWISIEEIKEMNSKISSKFFFHSFSEKRFSFVQMLHKLFVYTKYGYKSKGYQPQYYHPNQIIECFSNNQVNLDFFREKKLSFGTLVYDLPFQLTKDFINER